MRLFYWPWKNKFPWYERREPWCQDLRWPLATENISGKITGTSALRLQRTDFFPHSVSLEKDPTLQMRTKCWTTPQFHPGYMVSKGAAGLVPRFLIHRNCEIINYVLFYAAIETSKRTGWLRNKLILYVKILKLQWFIAANVILTKHYGINKIAPIMAVNAPENVQGLSPLEI